jgi:hypothetical protein
VRCRIDRHRGRLTGRGGGQNACSQAESVTTLDHALVPSGTFSSVRTTSSRIFFPPPSHSQKHADSECDYQWTRSEVPADYHGIYGVSRAETLGAIIELEVQMTPKAWREGRDYQKEYGASLVGSIGAGAQSTVHVGVGAQAYLESNYSGSGPTYNNTNCSSTRTGTTSLRSASGMPASRRK